MVTPEDADNISELTVTSSDTTIATVAQDEENPLKFTITGVLEGSATLTATLGELTDTCSVTVSLFISPFHWEGKFL